MIDVLKGNFQVKNSVRVEENGEKRPPWSKSCAPAP